VSEARVTIVTLTIRRAAMAKTPPNSGKDSSKSDVAQLKTELKQNTPTRVLGLHLGRSLEAVQAKANDLGLSTKPDVPPLWWSRFA
jgi:hypothetical protein